MAVVAQPEVAARSPVLELPERDALRFDLAWAAGMIGLLALVFLVLSLFRGVGIPLMLSVATAYALNPAVTWLARRRIKRSWATLMAFLALALLGIGFGLYLVPTFQNEAAKLPDFLGRASTQLFPWIRENFGVSVPELIEQRASALGSEASTLLQTAGPTLAAWLASAAGNTARYAATLIGLSVVPVLGFFFLRDFPRLIQQAQDLLPRPAVGLISRRFGEVDEVLSAFVQGQLTVGAILSVLYSVGLSIARIDLAIVIGVVAGFGNLLPYVGTGIGVLLALVGFVLSYQGMWQLAAIALTFALGQLLESLVITPRIVGDKVGLPPVVIILAVLGFGELFGFVGVLLALPTTAVLKVVLRVLLTRYQRSALYHGGR